MLTPMDPTFPVINLPLWKADAVVLHFWLSTVDLDAVPFEDPSQRQALLDLLTELDQTDVGFLDDADIVAAHAQVTRPEPGPVAPVPAGEADPAVASTPAADTAADDTSIDDDEDDFLKPTPLIP